MWLKVNSNKQPELVLNHYLPSSWRCDFSDYYNIFIHYHACIVNVMHVLNACRLSHGAIYGLWY